jgi:lysophospholipase L1-like esterase
MNSFLTKPALDDSTFSIPSFFKKLKAHCKQTMVLYGTSLTKSGFWPKLMEDWCQNYYPALVTIINSGAPGQNSNWGLAHLESEVLQHRPDVVFIEFSYNDAVQQFELPVEEAAQNLDLIILGIRNRYPSAEIVLQIMNVPWDAPDNPGRSKRPHLEAYKENYRRCACRLHLPLLDHYPAWKSFEALQYEDYRRGLPDGPHPTEPAVRLIMWPVLQKFLFKSHMLAENEIADKS